MFRASRSISNRRRALIRQRKVTKAAPASQLAVIGGYLCWISGELGQPRRDSGTAIDLIEAAIEIDASVPKPPTVFILRRIAHDIKRPGFLARAPATLMRIVSLIAGTDRTMAGYLRCAFALANSVMI